VIAIDIEYPEQVRLHAAGADLVGKLLKIDDIEQAITVAVQWVARIGWGLSIGQRAGEQSKQGSSQDQGNPDQALASTLMGNSHRPVAIDFRALAVLTNGSRSLISIGLTIETQPIFC
jgi:hypothetical protein